MNELVSGYSSDYNISYKLDELSKISFISESITQYGYSIKELVGRSILDIVYPEDIGKSRFRINERRTGNRKTVNFELRLLTKQGYPFYAIFVVTSEGIYQFGNAKERIFIGSKGILRDITYLKEAKDIIFIQQKVIKTIADIINHPVYVVDIGSMNIVTGNRFASSSYLKLKNPIYNELENFKNETLYYLVELAKETRNPVSVDYRYTKVYGYPVLDKYNKLTNLIVCLGKEVFDKKVVNWLSSDNSHISIISLDLEGNITGWNKRSEEVFAYLGSEVLGRHISFIRADDEKLSMVNGLLERLLKGEPYETKTTILAGSGKLSFIHCYAYLIRDEGRHPRGFMFYITPRSNLRGHKGGVASSKVRKSKLYIKHLKRRICEKEQLYKALFNSISDAVFVIDNSHIVDCNSRALEVFNCSYDQVIGKDISFLSPRYQSDGKDSIVELERYIKMASISKPVSYEWEYCRGGAIFNAEVSINSFSDKSKGILMVIKDISYVKGVEHSLQMHMILKSAVMVISNYLVTNDISKVDLGIAEGLHVIGNFINVDISYLGTFSEDRKKIFCNHYWSSRYLSSKPGDITCDNTSWWLAKLYSFQPVIINNLSSLPRGLSEEVNIFNSLSIKSLLIVPMVYNSNLLGFLSLVSVDKPKIWTNDIIVSVRVIADIFTSVLLHKRATDSTLKANHLLENILNSTNILVAYLNKDFYFVKVNKAYAMIYDKEPEYFIGKNYFNFDCFDTRRAIFKKVLETNDLYFAYAGVGPSGIKGNYWDSSVAPIKDINGETEGLILTFSDVSERFIAEWALVESKERYKTLVNSINEYIYSVEYYGGKLFRTYHSEKCFDITGYSVEEYLRNPSLAFDMIHPDDINYVIMFFRDIEKTFKPASIEHRIFHKNGSIRWLSNTCTARVKDGKLAGIDGFILDITKRKHFETSLRRSRRVLKKTLASLRETQDQLIQSEKMVSLGRLSAGIAHEINNPVNFIYTSLPPFKEILNGIFGLFDILEGFKYNRESSFQHIVNWFDSYGKDINFGTIKNDINCFFSIISEGTNRITNIVKAMQQFSAGNRIVMDKVNIHQAIDSTLHLLASKLKGGVTITKDYTDDPTIECNLTQVSQVFMNIISNAIHAVEDKGEIKIETKRKAGSFCINVSDTGCGIDKKNLVKIFEPFFTTKEAGKGTGLGLFISYELVKRHQGTINVTSELGRGTSFDIQLPIKQVDMVE